MIVAYAGRRAQSLGGAAGQVSRRLRSFLAVRQPSAVVGAAADGADLLVLEAALTSPKPPAIHIVLPTTRDIFAEHSVEAAWRDRFEAAMDAVARRGGTIRTLGLEPGSAAYCEGNQAILDTATSLAVGGERAVALVIAREGEGQMIEDLLGRARLAGVPSLRIDPYADR